MTMSSKQQDVAKSNISPTLFLTVDREPMSFFLRPGPNKRKLQPLITSGGGMMCSVQQPGAILLIDKDERGSIPETAAHWYVSIDYIYDCINQGKHLNIEDYRLNPEDIPKQAARLHSKKSSSGHTRGRAAYTVKEDAAILSYVRKHRSETGGNRLWQEMQKQRVTSHSWQSMKYRYRVILWKRLSDAEEEENSETEVSKSSRENAACPQTHSSQPAAPENELTQIEDQPVPATSSQPKKAEAETSNISQPEDPQVDPQEDALIPADSTEAAETQATVSPQKENVPEDSLQPPLSSITPQKQKEKQGASPGQAQQPKRRSTRRQLEASFSEPDSKKLRTSNSPQTSKKPQTADEKLTTIDPLPSKRAREMSTATAKESEDLERVETDISETPQPDEEWKLLEKPKRKKERRPLGILELATKEFEDESESSEDDATDLQHPPEREAIPASSTEPILQPREMTEDPVSVQSQATAPCLLSTDGAPEKGSPEPEPATGPATSDLEAAGPVASDLEAAGPVASDIEAAGPATSDLEVPGPAATETLYAASRAHLFIFDSESQEQDSQPLICDNATAQLNPQPLVNKDAAPSLTQIQLEEDVQQLRALMNQTNQDIVNVTKALLRTSGDISAALELLLNPYAMIGSCWTRYDDSLLISGDPSDCQQLQEKYGEKELAKRIVFLELERWRT